MYRNKTLCNKRLSKAKRKGFAIENLQSYIEDHFDFEFQEIAKFDEFNTIEDEFTFENFQKDLHEYLQYRNMQTENILYDKSSILTEIENIENIAINDNYTNYMNHQNKRQKTNHANPQTIRKKPKKVFTDCMLNYFDHDGINRNTNRNTSFKYFLTLKNTYYCIPIHNIQNEESQHLSSDDLIHEIYKQYTRFVQKNHFLYVKLIDITLSEELWTKFIDEMFDSQIYFLENLSYESFDFENKIVINCSRGTNVGLSIKATKINNLFEVQMNIQQLNIEQTKPLDELYCTQFGTPDLSRELIYQIEILKNEEERIYDAYLVKK